MTIWYSVGDDEGEFRSTYRVRGYDHISVPDDPADLDMDATGLCEMAAEDYHHHHDGWEAIWPTVISLHRTQDGPPVARCEVDREMSPEFRACTVERVDAGGDP